MHKKKKRSTWSKAQSTNWPGVVLFFLSFFSSLQWGLQRQDQQPSLFVFCVFLECLFLCRLLSLLLLSKRLFNVFCLVACRSSRTALLSSLHLSNLTRFCSSEPSFNIFGSTSPLLPCFASPGQPCKKYFDKGRVIAKPAFELVLNIGPEKDKADVAMKADFDGLKARSKHSPQSHHSLLLSLSLCPIVRCFFQRT